MIPPIDKHSEKKWSKIEKIHRQIKTLPLMIDGILS